MVNYVELDPAQITIKRDERQRRELKDLDSLSSSIKRVGQIQPIVITRDNVLVAGERRLTAIKQLADRNVKCVYMDQLSEFELQLIEYEENIVRADLPWQDQCRSIMAMHNLCRQHDPKWSAAQTAAKIGYSAATVSERLAVAAELASGNELVVNAPFYSTAKGIVQRLQSRKAEAEKSMLTGIINSKPLSTPLEEAIAAADARTTSGGYATEGPSAIDLALADIQSGGIASGLILWDNFNEWAPSYNGRKFNLIHCDFPYGVGMDKSDQGSGDSYGTYEDSPDVYWQLVDTLLNYLDNFCEESAHLVFWFSMDYYQPTLDRLRSRFIVNPFPLVWVKSDNSGILPDPNRGPRRTYETAFLASRGDRKIVKAVSNHVSSPIQRGNHMSEKPQEVLRHFFRMLIDSTSHVLDPTCGSGSAIRAARSLGAGRMLGIERNSEFVENAEELLKLDEEYSEDTSDAS